MKKIISGILAVAMLQALSFEVFAKDTSEMERVLSTVKERIGDTSKYDYFKSDTYDIEDNTVYSFYWSKRDDDMFSDLEVTACSDGVITRYYTNEYSYNDWILNNKKPTMNKKSSEELLDKAKDIMKRINPDICDSLVISKRRDVESLFDDDYSFEIQRYHNGVKVYEDDGNITISSDGKSRVSLYLKYTPDLNFKDDSSDIDKDKAWECYFENVGMKLVYDNEYDTDGKIKEVKLLYLPKMEYRQYINAETGELTNVWERSYYGLTAGGADAGVEYSKNEAAEDVAAYSFNRVEQEEIDKVSGLISKEEAEKIIRENKILDFDNCEELISVRLNKNYNNDSYSYKLNFHSNIDDNYKYASATIDAKTGEILSWYGSTNAEYKGEQSNDKRSEYIEKALKAMAPKHFDEYKLDGESGGKYADLYYRYVNDVPYNYDFVSIGVNDDNGKVNHYGYCYTDIEFPSTDNILSEKEAVEALRANSDLTKYYFEAISKGNEEKAKKAEFAQTGYMLDDCWMSIDAKTGKAADESYREKVLIQYTDIEDHYAKEAITTLAKYGIGFDTNEYKPNSIITQEDYITLLISTFKNNSPIILREDADLSYEYKNAKRHSILKEGEEAPEKPVTRENAAVYLIRALGYEEVANLTDIYVCPFDDVKSNKGAISILGAMKVFNGDEKGKFNPDKELTRGDAAIVIYNYLKNN